MRPRALSVLERGDLGEAGRRVHARAQLGEEEAPELVAAADLADGHFCVNAARAWRAQGEGAMRALAVVMLDVDAEYSLEVAPVKDEEPIEALGADGAYEALRNCVCLGARTSHDPDPLAAEDFVEGPRVLAVAVADQEADLLLGEKRRRGCVPVG
jgi:hypothetical protein